MFFKIFKNKKHIIVHFIFGFARATHCPVAPWPPGLLGSAARGASRLNITTGGRRTTTDGLKATPGD